MFTPYDYQAECFQEIKNGWSSGKRSLLAVLGVGAGKTFIAGYMMDLILKGQTDGADGQSRILYIAHEETLLKQPYAELKKNFPDVYRHAGLVQASRHNQTDGRVVIGSIQTLQNESRLMEVLQAGPITHLIVDECHHVMAQTYLDLIDSVTDHAALYGRELYHLGLTATPVRGDKIPLSVYDAEAYYIDLLQLVIRGYLIKPVFKLRNTGLHPSSMGVNHGLLGLRGPKYTLQEMMTLIEDEQREFVEMVVNQFIEDGATPSLFFMPTAELAYIVSGLLKMRGYRVEFIGHQTKDRERKIQSMRDLKLDGLTCYNTLTEGTNIPCIRTVYMGRPTKHDGAYQQMMGRGVRKWDGVHPTLGKKEYVNIVDFWPKDERFIVPTEDYLSRQGLGAFDIERIEPEPEPFVMTDEIRQLLLERRYEEQQAKLKNGLWNGKFSPIRSRPETSINENIMSRSPFEWVHIPGVDILATGTAADGYSRFFVVQEMVKDELYRFVFIGRKSNDPDATAFVRLIEYNSDRSLLLAVADGRGKRWNPNLASKAGQYWRSQPLTAAHKALADERGINRIGLNQGQLSDIILSRSVMGALEALPIDARPYTNKAE